VLLVLGRKLFGNGGAVSAPFAEASCGCGLTPGSRADAWAEQESFAGKSCFQTEALKKMDEELIAAAEAGDVRKLRELIGKGANINAKDSVRVGCAESCLQVPPTSLACAQNGDTPLHYAAYNGHVDAVRYLVEKGANINATNNVRERGCIALRVLASCLTVLCAGWMDAAPLGSFQGPRRRCPVPGGEGRQHQCHEQSA
jgi:Ankyrin repeat